VYFFDCVRMEHYLFLGMEDSVYPGNVHGDFVITLPNTYRLDGHWEYALLEISLHMPYHKRLHVCCDVIEDPYLKGTSLPLMRIIPTVEDNVTLIGCATVNSHLVFQRPHFISLRGITYLDRIRLFIRGSHMQPVSLDSPISCVLLLNKRR
jgi:hypothetical protein